MESRADNLFESQAIAHLQTLRGQVVILDSDLGWFLGIEPAEIITAVKKHPDLFPDDFVLTLTDAELSELRSRSLSLTGAGLLAGQTRLAFTTHGAGMLLMVFKDEGFALAAIPVLRAFAKFWKQTEGSPSSLPLVNRKS